MIAALATPMGQSALGVVRLSGAAVLKTAAAFLKAAERLEPRRATLLTARDRGRELDRVVATFFPGPGSSTGEDLLELSAHGSPFILSQLLDLALSAGARLAEPGEFTLRAYLNGRLDLAQAEAVGHLIRARTRAAHRAALAQLEGGLSRAVEALRERLRGVLAVVEAGLDHPDEDLPAFEPASAAAELGRVRGDLARLAATHRLGRLAAEGARVSIVGRPNAGKSSLLNALVGRDRAIVADEPGTTRDTLEEPAELAGLRAVLVDTAGLRPEAAAGAVEREGMRRARRSLEASDLAVLVVDRSLPWTPEDAALLRDASASGERPLIVALNKSDLPAAAGPREIPAPCVEVSATRGAGLERLAASIGAALGEGKQAAEGAPLVLTVRHRRALEEADAAVARALPLLEDGELAAVHLRESLSALAAVVGETPSEEVLREIFSRFCVGK